MPAWISRGAVLIIGEVLLRGRHLIQCGYPKLRHLSEGSAYLRSGAYLRKYGRHGTVSLLLLATK